MATEKNNELTLRESIQQLSTTLLEIIQQIFTLASLEFRLACKSVLAITLLLLFAGLFIVSAWFCILAALAFWLFSITNNWSLAILIVAALNLFILPLVFMCITRFRQSLYFNATRQQLFLFRTQYEQFLNEKLKETDSKN